ncbi:MAG: hypothetical protein L6Q31_09860 [Fimbriimonadaceae bacterium]|nr:hypothetical protein [Fimbriimonadaceae bacterium]
MRLAIGLGIVLLAATTLAQDGVFVDKRNNMSVKNWTSFVIHRVSDSLVEFKGEGKPLQAEWAGQRIELRTNSLSGSASVQAEGLLTLISADLQGAVWARQKLPSAQGASAVQSVEVEAGSATYLAQSFTWTLKSAVALRQSDPAAGVSFSAKGNSGSAALAAPNAAKPARFGMTQFELKGGVTFQWTRKEVKEGQAQTSTLKGSTDHLVFENAKGTLTLRGNVSLDGDSPALLGAVSASVATLTLDAEGNVTKIEFEGSPGKTVLKPPPGTETRVAASALLLGFGVALGTAARGGRTS